MRPYNIYYKRTGEFLGRYEATSPEAAAEKCLSEYSVRVTYQQDIEAMIRMCFVVIMQRKG